jgi:hypothetical protein
MRWARAMEWEEFERLQRFKPAGFVVFGAAEAGRSFSFFLAWLKPCPDTKQNRLNAQDVPALTSEKVVYALRRFGERANRRIAEAISRRRWSRQP